MSTSWLFAQNSTPRSACPHAQITLANDEEPTLCCQSCGKRWTFVPAGETPRYRADDDPTYPGMLDNRGWSRSARVSMTAPDDPSASRVVELEAELAETRDLAFAIHADIELSPEQLEVKQRLITDRYAKQVAKTEATFAESWTTAQRAGVTIVRCRHCGFEAFPFADATIVGHMNACRPKAQQ